MSLFSTIVWFIEQDPYTNVAMTLDVNYCIVKQLNFNTDTLTTGKDINKAIMDTTGDTDTFQNSPIHLLFYEKINESDYDSNSIVPGVRAMPPEIFSMSNCKLKLDASQKEQKFSILAYNMDLQLSLSGITAQLVTTEQLKQLLFILGCHPHNNTRRSCKDVLTLFNDFPTHTATNFKAMLDRLELPYIYDDAKTLAANRRDFNDFFLV